MRFYHDINEYLGKLKLAIDKYQSNKDFANQLLLYRLESDSFYKYFSKPDLLYQIHDCNAEVEKQHKVLSEIKKDFNKLQNKYKNEKFGNFISLLDVSIPFKKHPQLKDPKAQKELEDKINQDFKTNFEDKILNSTKIKTVPQRAIERSVVRVLVNEEQKSLEVLVMFSWFGFLKKGDLAEASRIRLAFERSLLKEFAGASVMRKITEVHEQGFNNELLESGSSIIKAFDRILL